MKLCPKCDQSVAEEITTCPSYGNEIGEGRTQIDDYRIVDVLHEVHSSLLCRAIRERTDEHVMIRLFSAESGVTEEVAARLTRELEALKRLLEKGFVRHYAIRRSEDGLWYRISDTLLGKQTEIALKKEAGESPENLPTSYTHLGFGLRGPRIN